MSLITPHSDPRDRHFIRNTAGISAVEFFWGLGLPVVVESTFLQLFLKSLGADDRVIGLVPALFSTGNALFCFVSAYLTTHLARKRTSVVLTHVSASVPLIAFGIILLAGGFTAGTVTIFLVCYFFFSAAIGVALPVWQAFLVKIFSSRRTVPALSAMMVVQTSGRLLGSFWILKMVESYSFAPGATGVTFLGIGAVFLLASFWFLIVEERAGDDGVSRDAHTLGTLFAALREIVRNRNFVLFLINTLESFTCITVISFYAVYAVQYHGIGRANAAGLFVACVYLGGIFSTLLFGWFNLFPLKYKYAVSKIFALAGIGLVMAADGLAGFLAASVFLGACRGITLFAFSPAVKRLSGKDDATDYFAAFPVLTLPVSFGVPFLCGIFLDSAALPGITAYRIMFASLGALILVSLVFLMATDFGDD